jgi:CheY-like chemotaxis protein
MPTIMVLEDNADLGFMIRQILEFRGHEVLYGYTGREGVVLLESAKSLPDIIFCDLMMPDMDGHEFIAYLKQQSEWAAIPFIIMSANGAPEDRDYAASIGASGFLAKPFGLQDLDALLAQRHM